MSQPGVVPGMSVELHAARAHLGVSQGHNPGSETQFFDTSGSTNHGTLKTFAFTTASGYAGAGTSGDPYRLVFDGGSDYVALPDLGACEDGVYAYECWAKHPSYAGNSVFMGEGANSGRLDIESRRVRFQVAGTSTVTINSADFTDDDAVHHMVAVADGTNMRLYVDDVLKAGPTALPANIVASSSTNLGYVNGGRLKAAASILAARIYPFALSAPQVAQNYAAGYLWRGDPPGACGFW